MVDDKRPAASKRSPRRDPYRLKGEVFNGRYRIEEYAGMGSFGAVYRATNLRVGSTVAVKILKPDLGDDEATGARELFQREALTAGRLSHRHIVAVTDVDEDFGFAYLVMEWLEGRTLEDELRARAPLPLEETATLLAQIADALQAAHDAGVIHRDIKPSNIHLGRHERPFVKMIDFGIAKVITSTTDAIASRIAGTLAYMSPEQISGGRIDHCSDIYSLGIMLYQMLTGELPFKGESKGQIIQQHLAATPPRLYDLRPELGLAVSNVIERALSKLPEQRQQSATELHQEFAAAALAPTHVLPKPAPQPRPRPFPPVPRTDPQRHVETQKLPEPVTERKQQRALYYALNGAFTLFAWSFLFWEPYDRSALAREHVIVAARDALFGAFVAITISEWRSPMRWAIVPGRRLKAFIVYGATGAALFMGVAVLGIVFVKGGILQGKLDLSWAFSGSDTLEFLYLSVPLYLLIAAAGFLLGILICALRLARPGGVAPNTLAQAETEITGPNYTRRFVLGGAGVAFLLSFVFWLIARVLPNSMPTFFPVILYDAFLGALLGLILSELIYAARWSVDSSERSRQFFVHGATCVFLLTLLYRLRAILSSGPINFFKAHYASLGDYMWPTFRLLSIGFIVGLIICAARIMARRTGRYGLFFTLAGALSAMFLSYYAWKGLVGSVSLHYAMFRNGLCGALVGLSLFELLSGARWSLAPGRRMRAFILHATTGAAILTGLAWLFEWLTMVFPSLSAFDASGLDYKNTLMLEVTLVLAGVGLIVGIIVWGVRMIFLIGRDD